MGGEILKRFRAAFFSRKRCSANSSAVQLQKFAGFGSNDAPWCGRDAIFLAPCSSSSCREEDDICLTNTLTTIRPGAASIGARWTMAPAARTGFGPLSCWWPLWLLSRLARLRAVSRTERPVNWLPQPIRLRPKHSTNNKTAPRTNGGSPWAAAFLSTADPLCCQPLPMEGSPCHA